MAAISIQHRLSELVWSRPLPIVHVIDASLRDRLLALLAAKRNPLLYLIDHNWELFSIEPPDRHLRLRYRGLLDIFFVSEDEFFESSMCRVYRQMYAADDAKLAAIANKQRDHHMWHPAATERECREAVVRELEEQQRSPFSDKERIDGLALVKELLTTSFPLSRAEEIVNELYALIPSNHLKVRIDDASLASRFREDSAMATMVCRGSSWRFDGTSENPRQTYLRYLSSSPLQHVALLITLRLAEGPEDITPHATALEAAKQTHGLALVKELLAITFG